jgi:hypothetical protein
MLRRRTVLRSQAVSSVLVGAKSAAQVEELAGAETWALDGADLDAILGRLPAAARAAQASVLEHILPEREDDLCRRRYDASLDAPIRYRA